MNDLTDPGTIIEEKISKAGGECSVRKYSKGKLIGKGGFARCYEITDLQTGHVMAGKAILKSSLAKSRSKQKLVSEIKIHKSLQHPGIVEFDHVFEDDDYVYILLEMCSNQSLHDLLKRRKKLTELEVQCYTVQIVNALKYLHSHRVIHRDLKLGNIFLTDKMEAKLGDFGLAAKLDYEGEKRRTVCGTPNYIAPEVIDGKSGHSYEVDVWALGVIIYALLVGKPPFETPDVKMTYNKIKACDYSFPIKAPVSDAARSLINRIFCLDPSKRPTLDEILQHPFINNGVTLPKLLPVSTLACPPSASYAKQFTPEGQVPVEKYSKPVEIFRRFLMTKTENSPPKRNVLVMTSQREVLTTAPQSPTAGQALTQSQTNIQTADSTNANNEIRQSRIDIMAFNKVGAVQPPALGSSTNLKTSARPCSVQHSEYRSVMSTRLVHPPTNNNLATTLSGPLGGFVGASRGKGNILKNEIWVKKWIDCATKYGLGYLLSNGVSGVFFNDNSKIVMNLKGTKFDYIERNPSTKEDAATSYTFDNYPKELHKKVTLLQHFKKHLEGDNKDELPVIDDSNDNNTGVYLKKWFKTKHAILFRLSNKVVQMNLTDKTEIILSSKNKMVTYMNKKGERTNYPLATALESPNTEMVKRLKYTKDILNQMLSENQQNHVPVINY